MGRKILYLFVALLLPACIFVFLKIFGKNEFAVPPLFGTEAPAIQPPCVPVAMPYSIPDSVMHQLSFSRDSLLLIGFGDRSRQGSNEMNRFVEHFPDTVISRLDIHVQDSRYAFWKTCVFFLQEPADLVLVDQHGRIRGQYTSSDLDEMDRLITEITIILKRY